MPQSATPHATRIRGPHKKYFNHQITQASNTAIPTLTHRTIPGIRKTRRILQLERQYKDIKHIIDTIGPTIQHYRQIIYQRETGRQKAPPGKEVAPKRIRMPAEPVLIRY